MIIKLSDEVIQEIEVALENTDTTAFEEMLSAAEKTVYFQLEHKAKLDYTNDIFHEELNAFRVKAVFKYKYLTNSSWVNIC